VVFVEHDEDEGEPWTEELKGRGGDLRGEDTRFDGEDGGAGYAEEERVFGDVFSCNYWLLALPSWYICVIEVTR
jgi:hypothetical protein